MATTYLFVPGQIQWAKGLVQVDEKYQTYNATLLVTKEEMDRVTAAGCQARFKPQDNNLFSFKIKKDFIRKNKDGSTSETSPPDVFLTDPTGTDIAVDPRAVGNGSDVTVKLELFDTQKGGKGTRLVKVRIENLIEYAPNENQEDMPF